MSTPLIVLIILGALVVLAVVVSLQMTLMRFVVLAWGILVWVVAKAITRVSAGRPRLGVSIMILAAVTQGAIGAWIVYLTTFVLSDYRLGASLGHELMIVGGMGAMLPATVFLRAAEVSQQTSVAFEPTSSGPIVLFLRSFATEGAFHDETPFFVGLRAESEEEEVAQLFAGAGLGEFVGLARPGQRFQELGAARVDIGSQDWQEAISRLIARSNAVAMQLGDSEALLWELDVIVRSGKLHRTLFFLPSAVDEDDLRTKYSTVLAKIANKSDYPRFPSELKAGARFLYFDDEGLAHVVVHPEEHSGNLAELLGPFFRHLGVANPTPPTEHINFIGKIVGAFLLLYVLVVHVLPRLGS